MIHSKLGYLYALQVLPVKPDKREVVTERSGWCCFGNSELPWRDFSNIPRAQREIPYYLQLDNWFYEANKISSVVAKESTSANTDDWFIKILIEGTFARRQLSLNHEVSQQSEQSEQSDPFSELEPL